MCLRSNAGLSALLAYFVIQSLKYFVLYFHLSDKWNLRERLGLGMSLKIGGLDSFDYAPNGLTGVLNLIPRDED